MTLQIYITKNGRVRKYFIIIDVLFLNIILNKCIKKIRSYIMHKLINSTKHQLGRIRPMCR